MCMSVPDCCWVHPPWPYAPQPTFPPATCMNLPSGRPSRAPTSRPSTQTSGRHCTCRRAQGRRPRWKRSWVLGRTPRRRTSRCVRGWVGARRAFTPAVCRHCDTAGGCNHLHATHAVMFNTSKQIEVPCCTRRFALLLACTLIHACVRPPPSPLNAF